MFAGEEHQQRQKNTYKGKKAKKNILLDKKGRLIDYDVAIISAAARLPLINAASTVPISGPS